MVQLEKGVPGDPRFPERDEQYITEQTKLKDTLVQWLEEFKSKLGEYDEAKSTIEECENCIALYNKVVGAARVPMMIKQARNARRNDGSCLEYGLEYHLKQMNSAVSSEHYFQYFMAKQI